MGDFTSIPKMTVRNMHLRTLIVIQFSSALLRNFLDVLDLPSLETYCCHTVACDVSADNVISLLNRSGAYLKRLTLDVRWPCAEDIKKLLLDASPYLQHLRLDFFWTANAPGLVHELFEDLSSSPPISVGNVPRFLPNLQSLTIFGSQISMWTAIPRLFSWPHRKLLHLEVNKLDSAIEIDNDTLRTILRLVDEGINIRIFGGRRRVDYLQESKKHLHESGPSEGSEVVDHALEDESLTADEDQEEYFTGDNDREGCLTSFLSFISCIFCRR
jgi:hypothetical protein